MVTGMKGKKCGKGYISAKKVCNPESAPKGTTQDLKGKKPRSGPSKAQIAYNMVLMASVIVGVSAYLYEKDKANKEAEKEYKEASERYKKWSEEFNKQWDDVRKNAGRSRYTEWSDRNWESDFNKQWEEAKRKAKERYGNNNRYKEPPTENEINDWRDVLGVSKNATPDEIKKAYKEKAKKFHPDVNKSPEAEEMMKKINNAFDYLGRNDSIISSRRIGKQVLFRLKQVIDTVFTGGIDTILSVDITENNDIVGRFKEGQQVYDYKITADNRLSYNETKIRGDAYLIGWFADTGNLRFDAPPVVSKKKQCLKGKPCGGSCIQKGLECSRPLSNKSASDLQQIRKNITQIKKASDTTSTPSEQETAKKFNLPTGVVSGVLLGAFVAGMPVAGYVAFRNRYRERFTQSGTEAAKQSIDVETQLRKDAAARTGKSEEELTKEDIYTIERYPAGSDKKRKFSVDPDKPYITFTIGGFNDYGEDGTGMAVTLKRALDEDSIIPLTNKKVQISPEDTWIPMNDVLDDTEDPDGKGSTVKRGFFARRGATDVLKKALGDKYPEFINKLRNNETYKQVEPVARLLIRNSRDIGLLANNATMKGYHADAIDAAAQIMAFQRAYPDKPIRIVAHSGGGYAAAEAAEILKRRGIGVKVANIATPYWGLTELSKDELITIGSKGDYMMGAPVQNRVEIDDVTAHNWVAGGGKQGYGSSKQMETELRKFFYGANKAERKKKSRKDSYIEGLEAALRLDVPTKPGYDWVKDKRVKAGGYFRKSRKGTPQQQPASPPSRNNAVAIGASVAGLAVLAGGGAMALSAASKNPEFQREVFKISKNLNKALKDADQEIEKALDNPDIPKSIATTAKNVQGYARVLVAKELAKNIGYEVGEYDKENNVYSMRKKDGSIMTIGSISNNVVTFTASKESVLPMGDVIEENAPTYRVDFQVNNDYSTKRKELPKEESDKVMKMVKASWEISLKQMEQPALINTSAYDGDGKGKKRSSIYKRMGFRGLTTDATDMMFAQVQNGKIKKLSQEQLDQLSQAFDEME